MDPLSQAIALLKPQTVAWQIIEGHDDWALRLPANDFVVFGQMIEGCCKAELADGTEMDLETGDFLLISKPSPWLVYTSRDAEPRDLKAVLADPDLLRSVRHEPLITRLMAGAFALGAPNAALLASLMPTVVQVRAAEVQATSLGAMLGLLKREALANQPGRSLVLDRLLEIMLVKALRCQPSALNGSMQGMLAGLADVQIGAALQLMHSDATKPWTVGELARQVGLSRSGFAARFAAKVGMPPIDYLLQWRMATAKAALISSEMPMSEVAALAGYASVSAFSTAFSRATGCPPSRFTRTASVLSHGGQAQTAP